MVSPGHTHQYTSWPAVPCKHEKHGSQVSFHSQCRGVKFYELRSAGAEWGTKLKLVKESTTPHDPLCVAAWVPGIPSEKGVDGARPLRRTGRTRRRETLHDTHALPNG